MSGYLKVAVVENLRSRRNEAESWTSFHAFHYSELYQTAEQAADEMARHSAG